MTVPEVLFSGDHAKIADWKAKESLRRTWQRRPDLLINYPLSEQQKQWLDDIKREESDG